MKNQKHYTEEETLQFKVKRNAKSNYDKRRARAMWVIWPTALKGTFVGSIRQQFTGEKRCGITNH